MSDPLEEIRGAAGRLRELAERLRDPELDDEQAAELAREAAEVVSRAGNDIDRALRDDAAQRE
ncbi:MAG: hypothetical protein ACJ75R_12070 [Solirubrobacterales bacterium]